MNILLLPLPRQEQPNDLKNRDIAYISKRKTVKDLAEKLISAYGEFFPAESLKVKRRLWKVDPHFNLNTAWEKYNGGNQLEIHGVLLNEETTIEV